MLQHAFLEVYFLEAHFSTQAVQAACCEEVKGGAVTDFDLVLYGAGTGHGHGRAAPTLHTTPSPCHVGALTLTPYRSPGSRQQYNGAAQCRRLASFVLFRNTKQYKCITKHRPPVRGCLWASGGSRRGPHCSPAEPTPPPSYPQGEKQGDELKCERQRHVRTKSVIENSVKWVSPSFSACSSACWLHYTQEKENTRYVDTFRNHDGCARICIRQCLYQNARW